MKFASIAAITNHLFGHFGENPTAVVDDSVRQQFIEHLALYGKSYGTEEEFEYRLSVFDANMKFINEHNSRNDGDAQVGINHMADWSNQEYRRLLGYKPALKKRAAPAPKEVNLEDLPDAVNWVEAGAVTPVKNQGMCGSCWAFSTTGAMEGRYQIKSGDLQSFSEQQFVDCSSGEGNQGCNGGLMDLAFQYAEKNSIDTESQYPYKGRDGTCAAVEGVAKVNSFTDVTPKSPSALMAAVAEGPVSIAIDAGGLAMQFYFGGIIKHFCGTSLDHGVLLVGYGSSKGEDYWLVKNSWGAGWGEKGFFRIYRDAKEGQAGVCGLQLQPSYPEF